MSVDLAHHAAAQHSHQFEDIDQQNECYVVGMWSFLVTEVMFFGALFLCYTLYRGSYPDVFYSAHLHLNVALGAINTLVLLTSSLFMALAVWCGQIGKRRGQINWMCVTIVCAFMFLGIKAVEYTEKFKDNLYPGPTFHYEPVASAEPTASPDKVPLAVPGLTSREGLPSDKYGMFFSLYFAMTGLHGIHVIIGILVMGAMVILLKRDHPCMRDYMPTEMAGLYWHFVDIVWIFLFPLYYLIPK